MKRIDEYRDKTVDELKKAEADLTAEVFRLRFQVAYKQLENPMKLQDGQTRSGEGQDPADARERGMEKQS